VQVALVPTLLPIVDFDVDAGGLDTRSSEVVATASVA
jgi:hypothetical protein